MFTGIIEATGVIEKAEQAEANLRLTITSEQLGMGDVMIGDSIAVNGVCLTVVEKSKNGFYADVSQETLDCTTGLAQGARVNLEKSLRFGDRVGGHLVSGHVDGVGTVEAVTRVESTARVRIALGDPALAPLLIPQGSVAVEGVSLTVAALAGTTFEVMLIPHTLAATTLDALAAGQAVNIETDVIGKYVVRSLALRGTT